MWNRWRQSNLCLNSSVHFLKFIQLIRRLITSHSAYALIALCTRLISLSNFFVILIGAHFCLCQINVFLSGVELSRIILPWFLTCFFFLYFFLFLFFSAWFFFFSFNYQMLFVVVVCIVEISSGGKNEPSSLLNVVIDTLIESNVNSSNRFVLAVYKITRNNTKWGDFFTGNTSRQRRGQCSKCEKMCSYSK